MATLAAIISELRTSTNDDLRLAREEVLRHVLERAGQIGPQCTNLPVAPACSPANRPDAKGIRRHTTPDSKVRVAPSTWLKTVDERPMKKRKPSPTAEVDAVICQVCQLQRHKWPTGGQAPLLNALEKPVRVPGHFCSKDCYEHI